MSIRYYTHGSRKQNKIALTFDDGPNPPRTDQVMDILEAKGVRGTFFVLGKWAERFPQALERIVRRGHVVGNHSHLHSRYIGDFDRAEAAIANITGKPSCFLRVHYLNNYATCIQSPLAQSDSIYIIDSDVNPADYAQTDPQEIVRRTLEHKDLAGGSIIDLHDSVESDDDARRLSRPLPMTQALPTIIDELQARGFQLVGLDEIELVDPIEWRQGS